MQTHNKLVRDKIPSIIIENGDIPEVKFLTGSELIVELDNKLKEEFNEYIERPILEELVDVVEVAYAIAFARGVGEEEFDDMLYKKREERGGFGSRIFLVSTKDKND